MKLNLGCGRNPMPGYVNVDRMELPGVDLVADLDTPYPLGAFPDDSVEEIVGIDLIEHIANPMQLMQALWHYAKPGALCRFELPYGSSDDAWEDPTHVRPYFIGSWGYFSQPFYHRADYGYRGDWAPRTIELHTRPGVQAQDVMVLRNVVLRQVVTFEAIKPAREPLRELMDAPDVKLIEVR